MTRSTLGDDYVELGIELRRIRVAAGKNTSQVGKFSSSHVSLVENGKSQPSEGFIEEYIRLGADRDKLMALYKKAKKHTELTTVQSGGQLLQKRPALVIERRQLIFHFSESGSIIDQAVIMDVRATDSPVEQEIYINSSYRSDDRKGVLEIEPLSGCRVTQLTESEDSHISATIEPHKRIAIADGLYSLSYRFMVNSKVRCHPVVSWQLLTPGTRHISFQLNFDPAAVPTRAWWFASLRYATGLQPELNQGQHLDALADGTYVYKAFEGSPLLDRIYGVGWAWD